MVAQNSKTNHSDDQSKSIPVIKEALKVEKKHVQTGKVIVKKEVIEEDVNYDINLQSEKVKIERIPRNIEVDKSPDVRKEGNTTIIPVVKEVIVKKLVLVEEIHLEKWVEERTETISETLREEKIHIKRESTDQD
jgi:uncharacterized protein (TIGR02271 family)